MNNKIIIFFLVVCWSFRFVSEFRKPMMSGSTFCCCYCCFHSSWFVNLYHNNNDNLFFFKTRKKSDQKKSRWNVWPEKKKMMLMMKKTINQNIIIQTIKLDFSVHISSSSSSSYIQTCIFIFFGQMNPQSTSSSSSSIQWTKLRIFFFDKPNLIVHHDFFLFEFSPYFNEINLNFFLFSNKKWMEKFIEFFHHHHHHHLMDFFFCFYWFGLFLSHYLNLNQKIIMHPAELSLTPLIPD